MQAVIEKIQQMSDQELQDVMKAIEQHLRDAYPDQDIVYLAVHKDPALRKQEFEAILKSMKQDLSWHQKG